MHIVISGMLVSSMLFGSMIQRHVAVGPLYSSHLLYRDDEEAMGVWRPAGEIGVMNIVPHIGMKFRATTLRYDAPAEQGSYSFEYIPLSLCTSFDILPFFDISWLHIGLETGLGMYWWKGLYEDEVITLPTGEAMEERDIGFIVGMTLQIHPLPHIGIEYGTRYHYLTSAEPYKYGFLDKDEKLWEHGIGVKFLWNW
ncbi:MAG: hypothetical protein JSW02_01645 [candidate division WOR-3 bacterium]|nr:MAG: hypothetical protein JSW02_01645 [candidate division WOR-3 bacterium]